MARLNICGFETGDDSELYSWAGGTALTIQSTTKRTGSYAAKWKPNGAASFENFTVRGLAADGTGANFSDPATIYIRFYLYIAAAASGDMNLARFFKRTGGNALKGLLSLTSARKLKFLDAGSTTTTGTTVLSTGQWYRIEAKVGTGASNASWEVKIDGTSEISSLTANLTANGCSECTFGYYNTAPTDGEIYWDDIAIDDAAYPGAGEVHILKPNATGTTSAWTNGAGTSPTNVAEVPHDSDTGYITSSTNGNVTTVNLDSSATGGVSGTIAATKNVGIVRDEGGASSLKIRAKSSATTSDTTAVGPGSTYVALSKILTTDPNTSAAWTTSGLDALEIGVVNSASVAVRCTALYAMVECAPPVTATKDVAEDAAISTTNTKDIAADAATTTTATKDVATAAATTATVTLDLAEAAVVSTSNTKDVAEAAAIQTTVTLDLAEAAAVTTVGTKDVAEAAILTTTGTKDVASDAALSTGTVVTLDLATAASVGFTSAETRKAINSAGQVGYWYTTYVTPWTPVVGNPFGTVVNGFVRYSEVPIPQGATILSATLAWTVGIVSDNPAILIKGSAEDNAGVVTSYADLTGRTRTTAQAAWTPSPTGTYTTGQTADFASVLQEIVNRAGWAENNALMLFLEDNGSAVNAYWQTDITPTAVADLALTVTWAHPVYTRRTKDVTADAVLTRTVTLDLATAAVTTTTNTKDVAEQAVVTTTNTKDVAEDAALTAPATKDVAADATLEAGISVNVGTDAVITCTVTLDLAEAAVVTIDHTADVATDASLVLGGIKDVASDAILTAPATKDVASDAVITVTRSGLDLVCEACIVPAGAGHPVAGSAELANVGAGTALLERIGVGSASISPKPGGTASIKPLGRGTASIPRRDSGTARYTRPGGSA